MPPGVVCACRQATFRGSVASAELSPLFPYLPWEFLVVASFY